VGLSNIRYLLVPPEPEFLRVVKCQNTIYSLCLFLASKNTGNKKSRYKEL